MENALLVGLSRQVALQRELDVVSNNIANLNTTGFKADGNLFEEYLMPGAREGGFKGNDGRVSFVQDRATWQRFRPGARLQQTGNPLDVAIDGNGFLAVRDAARRALHPQRLAADQRCRRARDVRRLPRRRRRAARSCSSRRTATSRSARTAPSPCRRAVERAGCKLVNFAQPQQLAEGRRQHFRGTGRRRAASRADRPASSRARSRGPTCAACSR